MVENINGVPVLTKTGLEKIGQLKKTELLSGWLLVAFDIPEKRRKDRDYLRNYLKTNDFIILQKSIWYTNLDKTEELKEVIVDLNLGSHVCIFMAAHVFAPGLSSSN